jgi:hypothetical protein
MVNKLLLSPKWVNQRYAAISIVVQFGNFYIAQMRFARDLRIVVKNVPLAFYFHNGMVGRPTLHRFHKGALVGKRPPWAGANGVGQQMGIARRVGKIILAIVFMHPGSFKKTPVMVFANQGFAVFINNYSVFYRAFKMQHILPQQGYSAANGGLVILLQVGF